MKIDPFKFLCLVAGLLASTNSLAGTVQISRAPEGEVLSTDYTVQVEGQDPVPVYSVKVAPADRTSEIPGHGTTNRIRRIISGRHPSRISIWQGWSP